MKLTQIALAVTSLVALPALAVDLTASVLNGGYNIGTRIVRISGATALSGTLASVVATNCTGGLANVRTFAVGTAPTTSTSDGRVTVCTTSANIANSFTTNGPFAVIKLDTGGSFQGVGPVISQLALDKWANLTNCTAPGAGSGATIVGSCAFDPTLRVPHAGMTDVDYNVWKGLSNTGGLSAASPVPPLGTTVTGGGFAGQGFGVMAGENMYRAMQVVQVNEGRLPAACSSGAVPPAATLASVALADPSYTAGLCQPSISKAEYAAIVDGSNFAYINSVALTGNTSPINLCRRVETSGTQATSNVYFLNNSCGFADPTFGFKNPKKAGDFGTVTLWDTASGNAVTGNYDDVDGAGVFSVFEGSGTGDARNCVIRRNGGLNPNNVADPALGNYAIGWISLENAPASGWKLLKLDGVSPNAVQVVGGTGWTTDLLQRTNVVEGYYDAAPELEMLWPANTIYSAFLTGMRTDFGTPSVISPFKGIFVANGNGGATHAANPTVTHKGTRSGNFCKPQALAE